MQIDTTPSRPSYRFSFDGVEFNEARLELRVQGDLREVEPRPLALLAELLHRVGEVVTREELVELLWQGRPTVRNVLANAVTKLRDALGERAATRLVTVPRVGYRFDGPVAREVLGQPVPAAADLFAGLELKGQLGTYLLVASIDTPSRHAVWRSRGGPSDQAAVLKFAVDGSQLTTLKREWTLCRYLQQSVNEPSVAPRVLDHNFSDSPYFLAVQDMGPDLAVWAAQDGRLKGLSREQRLRLACHIVQAVARAHAVGVLHKDIKPANIAVRPVAPEADDLIAAWPWQVALLDFGSSWVTERQRLEQLQLTQLGMTIADVGQGTSERGTFLYAAPELLESGRATLQGDVHALGVLLFQLVLGDLTRPMSTGWQRLIDDELLVADITAATEGDPAQRLGSAAELLQRLEQLPARRDAARVQQEAQAQAQHMAQRLSQLRQRRPWQWALLSTMALGLCASSWMYFRARQAGEQALQAQAQAQAAVQFLTLDVMGAGSPRHSDESQQRLTLAEVADRVATLAQQRLSQQPLVEALIQGQTCEQRLLGREPKRAREACERAMKLLEPGVQTGDERMIDARLRWSRTLSALGQIELAEAELAKVDREAARPPEQWPAALAAAREMAWSEYHSAKNENAKALAHASRRLELIRRDAQTSIPVLFFAESWVARRSIHAGHFDEARASFERLEAMLNKPGMPQWANGSMLGNRAILELYEGRYAEARQSLEAMQATLRADGFPAPRDRHSSLILYALSLEGSGDQEAAARVFAEARMVLGPSRPGEEPELPKLRHMALASEFGARLVRSQDAALAREFLALPSQWSGIEALEEYVLNEARALIILGQPGRALARLRSFPLEPFELLGDVQRVVLQIQAEIARALLRSGQREAGEKAMRAALEALASARAPAWLQTHYANELSSL